MNLDQVGKGVFSPEADLPNFRVSMDGGWFFVDESLDIRRNIFNKFCFGVFYEERLVLSAYEVYFLLDVCKCIDIKLKKDDLWNECSKIFSKGVFPRLYSVYSYYRSNLWVVRDGSVFGAHFVLYSDHPDIVHSRYMVQVLESWEKAEKEAIICSRIAWSVKKEVILCVAESNSDDFSNDSILDKIKIQSICVKRCKFR